MDIRHPLKPFDEMMLQWAAQQQLPVHILLNKADKLSRGAARNTLIEVQKKLAAFTHTQTSLQCFSAIKHQGEPQAREQIALWLASQNPEETA
jgi:GTP-binding protein